MFLIVLPLFSILIFDDTVIKYLVISFLEFFSLIVLFLSVSINKLILILEGSFVFNASLFFKLKPILLSPDVLMLDI